MGQRWLVFLFLTVFGLVLIFRSTSVHSPLDGYYADGYGYCFNVCEDDVYRYNIFYADNGVDFFGCLTGAATSGCIVQKIYATPCSQGCKTCNLVREVVRAGHEYTISEKKKCALS